MKVIWLLMCVAFTTCAHPQEWSMTQREAMVRDQIEARGVKDPRVLATLRRVPRERFVSPGPARRIRPPCSANSPARSTQASAA
jgi:hypothetical protein